MKRLGRRSRIWRHAPWVWLLAAAPAAALQILDATDHAELSAEVSSSAVNRIALEDDRIERVVESSGAFTLEHDPVRGDLYLYPVGGAPTAGGAPAGVTLYVGTEGGFTYRLSLTVVARDSAQILIRNRALARMRADRGMGAPGGHESELAALVRAVATRSPPPGYVIVSVPNVADPAGNSAGTGGDVSLVELWRGPRYSARVLSVRAGIELSASQLAESYGQGAVAVWLEPGSTDVPADGSPAGGSRADEKPCERDSGRAARGRRGGDRYRGGCAVSAGDAVNRAVQRNQWLLFVALAGVVLVLFVLWMGGGGQGSAPSGGIDARLAGPGEAEAGWVRVSETRFGGIEARLRDIEAANRRLQDENQRLQLRLSEEAENALDVIDRQAAMIDELAAGGGANLPGVNYDNPFAPATPLRPASASETPSDGDAAAPLSAPRVIEFTLEDRSPRDSAGPPDAMPIVRRTAMYVPAGSYAEAVVIAGADASAAVQSQGDPRPVLLRLTSPAYGAAEDGIASESDIEGCTVTGAAYGDLSSEKVYVRLQTMACAGREQGTVIETAVSGFVAGGGKSGVRGPVVSREGALVERAFLAGVFSGFGQSASQAFGPQAVLTGGGAAVIANRDIESIGRSSLGSGAATAGQQVSDYLIRRAEQYQPVIQLAAGTPVTVVFLEGAWLDGQTADAGTAAAQENRS